MSVTQVSEVIQTQTTDSTSIELVGGANTKGNRSFKVKLEQNGPLYGRYNGDSPYQAANKALSEIIRTKVKQNLPDNDDIKFFLVESTKNSSKKTHEYVGRRTKLAAPVEYEVANGQTIKKEYKNVLRKVKKTVQKGGSTSVVEPSIISTELTTNGATVTISAPIA
jgi:hypothetical protein